MSVSRVLHIVHVHAVEGACSVVDDLEALFERCWLSLNVTSAHKEDLVSWGLHVCKVVLESVLNAHDSLEDLLGGQIILIDEF